MSRFRKNPLRPLTNGERQVLEQLVHARSTDFEEAVNALLSPDEPHAQQRPIPHLNRESYQGRTWATRRNLWVDRVASAWLIRRSIDSDAMFLWLDSPSQCPQMRLALTLTMRRSRTSATR